ncbi:MAG: hypothetical protein HYV63_20235 [Candidatus Schekmanbacteria bacterium]|nr:hypothetical protein [Candidatus Schekmanbacteria bacterium]
MRTLVLISGLVAALLLAAGCNLGGKESPSAVATAVCAAARDKNEAEFWRRFSKVIRDSMAEIEKLDRTGKAGTTAIEYEKFNCKPTAEKIEGDKAVVAMEGAEVGESLLLKKEEGHWVVYGVVQGGAESDLEMAMAMMVEITKGMAQGLKALGGEAGTAAPDGGVAPPAAAGGE